MYRFSDEAREILEKQKIALAVYQQIDGKILTVLVSDGCCDIRQDTREHLIAALNLSMYERVAQEDAGVLAELGREFCAHKGSYDIIYRSSSEAGVMRPIHAVGFWRRMPDGTDLAFIYYTDLSRSKRLAEETIERYLTLKKDHFYFDPLTKLPNHNYLHEFGDEKAQAIRLRGGRPVLIYFNVCAMQSYNNQYGYAAGNDLLCTAANVLRRKYPDALITRGYGDYFQVITGEESCEELIHRVNDELIRTAKGNTAGLKAGVCKLTESDTTLSALDHARHAFKAVGFDLNTKIAVYSQKLDEDYFRQRCIVDHFETALNNGWIHVFYQGIVESKHGKISYGEALARWIDPNQGMISPGEFIPILRKYHLLYKMDLYMVEQVCREYEERRKLGYTLVPVSVNLSAQDFDHVDMFQKVLEILSRYGVPAEKIVIEMTEQDIATQTKTFKEQVNQFLDHGFRIWVDDFGSGYSGYGVFARYRFHLIKIDQKLMGDLSVSNKILIRGIVQTIKQLGIQTLCEGVETEEQYQFAKEAGIDFIQGFYFYKPTSLAVVEYERRLGPESGLYEELMDAAQDRPDPPNEPLKG